MGGATEGVVFLWFCRTLRVEEKVGMLSYVGSEIFHSCAPELGGARDSRPKRTQLYVLTSVSVVQYREREREKGRSHAREHVARKRNGNTALCPPFAFERRNTDFFVFVCRPLALPHGNGIRLCFTLLFLFQKLKRKPKLKMGGFNLVNISFMQIMKYSSLVFTWRTMWQVSLMRYCSTVILYYRTLFGGLVWIRLELNLDILYETCKTLYMSDCCPI